MSLGNLVRNSPLTLQEISNEILKILKRRHTFWKAFYKTQGKAGHSSELEPQIWNTKVCASITHSLTELNHSPSRISCLVKFPSAADNKKGELWASISSIFHKLAPWYPSTEDISRGQHSQETSGSISSWLSPHCAAFYLRKPEQFTLPTYLEDCPPHVKAQSAWIGRGL